MALILKQSTAVDVLIGPFLDSTNAYDGETGISPAVKLSKNGQALGAKNDATTPVHDADGYYNCEFDSTDTDTVGTMVLSVVGSATSLPVRHEFQVVEEAVYVDLYAASAAGPSRTTALSALAQGKPSATPTLDVAIMHMYWDLIYGKQTVDSSGSPAVKTVFAADESTALFKQNGTDSASVFTRAEVITGA